VKKNFFDEIIGWYGVLVILVAYALNAFNYITTTSIYYLLLNITGAAGIVYISIKKRAYQPAVLNLIWAIIALIVIIKLLF